MSLVQLRIVWGVGVSTLQARRTWAPGRSPPLSSLPAPPGLPLLLTPFSPCLAPLKPYALVYTPRPRFRQFQGRLGLLRDCNFLCYKQFQGTLSELLGTAELCHSNFRGRLQAAQELQRFAVTSNFRDAKDCSGAGLKRGRGRGGES